MEDRVTVSHKEWIRINAEVHELKMLLKRAKTTIDHARKWRTNVDPDFEDKGIYRKVSNEIEEALK
jgi:hypothetical protein